MFCRFKLLKYFYENFSSQGYALRAGESYVGDSVGPNETSPHRRDGAHFNRTGEDLILDGPDGQPILDGGHPMWGTLGSFWESLHPLARNGRNWNDANHFSIELPSGVK